MVLGRIYPDERAIPVRTKVGNYSVLQWWNPDEDVALIMATFPVVNGRISLEGEMPIFNVLKQKPEMAPVTLMQFHDKRGDEESALMETHPVDLWERPLWLVVLFVLAAVFLALVLLVGWLRLRS